MFPYWRTIWFVEDDKEKRNELQAGERRKGSSEGDTAMPGTVCLGVGDAFLEE